MSAAPTRNLIVRHAAVGALTVVLKVPAPARDDRAVCASVRWLPARPTSLMRCEIDELQRVRDDLSATVQRATGARLELPQADRAVFDGRIEIEPDDLIDAPEAPQSLAVALWNSLPASVVAGLRLAPLPPRSAELRSVASPPLLPLQQHIAATSPVLSARKK